MRDAVKPTSKVYRFIVRKPVRTGINNLGRNITYPTRLINTLLQGRWKRSRDETRRFLCNTFVGGAGFVDVASRGAFQKRRRTSARRSAGGDGGRNFI